MTFKDVWPILFVYSSTVIVNRKVQGNCIFLWEAKEKKEQLRLNVLIETTGSVSYFVFVWLYFWSSYS